MVQKIDLQKEQNETATTLAVFIDAYNKNLPQGFPKASAKILERFRAAHLALFKGENDWSIDKHRKRVMDWLSMHHDDK